MVCFVGDCFDGDLCSQNDDFDSVRRLVFAGDWVWIDRVDRDGGIERQLFGGSSVQSPIREPIIGRPHRRGGARSGLWFAFARAPLAGSVDDHLDNVRNASMSIRALHRRSGNSGGDAVDVGDCRINDNLGDPAQPD